MYVYGGVIGSLDYSHKPILASGVEKYDFHSNKWQNISIKGLPNLTGFGYCFNPDNELAYIFGGSDGNFLVGETYEIDFRNEKATNMNVDYTSTAFCKLVVRTDKHNEKDTTLYIFGGMNTDGQENSSFSFID